MAQQPDLPGPTTSYSDPFYDRLESVAQRITKRLWLLLLALVVIVVVAVVTHSILRDTPIAASAGRFLDAATLRMEAEQADPAERTAKFAEVTKAFTAVAADETVTPYYRARAGIELTQIELDRSALSEAKAAIEKARAQAAKALDPDLDLAVGLSEAAVLAQSGDHAGAEARYLAIERAAGLTHPDRQVAATLGAAQALTAQGRVEDAIAKLEPLITRTDPQATVLLALARNEYWSLKRKLVTKPAADAQAPATPPVPAPVGNDAPATPAPTAAPAAAQPTSTPAPAAAPAAPAPVVAPQPAPAAPAPVTPAPGPEGK